MKREHGKIVGKILGGNEYTEGEEPLWWRNKEYLPYFILHIAYAQLPFIDPLRRDRLLQENAIDPKQLPLNGFPLIEDFEVILWRGLGTYSMEESEKENKRKYHTRFFSVSHGFLASFFYGDYSAQDLCAENFLIPHGDFNMPWFNFDQGWIMLIAENEGFVYILHGSFEEVREKKGYHTWFRVEKQRYYSQWEQAIHLCRKAFQNT